MPTFPVALVIIVVVAGLGHSARAQTSSPPVRVALLDMGDSPMASRTVASLRRSLSGNSHLILIDAEESRAAARGVGYAGSLNMTLQEARDLGAAIGCEFFFTGDVQTVRRSPSTRPVYFEAYASIFIVSGRSGRLIRWQRPSVEGASEGEAEKLLLQEVTRRAPQYAKAVESANANERDERIQALERVQVVIDDAPEDEEAATRNGIRMPQPYRRLRPSYTDEAAQAEAEATVDVRVDIDIEGEVSRVEIVRWAGFGLDEATLSTVRQLHFRPATRDKLPIPLRVLLRYNFRRPAKEN